jgi:hypothetical protein
MAALSSISKEGSGATRVADQVRQQDIVLQKMLNRSFQGRRFCYPGGT